MDGFVILRLNWVSQVENRVVKNVVGMNLTHNQNAKMANRGADWKNAKNVVSF